jgi:hypothetical protein
MDQLLASMVATAEVRLFLVFWLTFLLGTRLWPGATVPYVVGSCGGVAFLFWLPVLKAGAIDAEGFTRYAFLVPYGLAGANALGYLFAAKLQKPGLRYIISAGIGFSTNVLIGLLSGYASQYTGAQYIKYLMFSASLYLFVFVFVLQSLESAVVKVILDHHSKESAVFSLLPKSESLKMTTKQAPESHDEVGAP